MTDKEQKANEIWDILVEHAGANKEDYARSDFVFHFSNIKDDFFEYRFGGHLAFGGKLKVNLGRVYVSCYSEDETPKMREIINKVNGLLKKFETNPLTKV